MKTTILSSNWIDSAVAFLEKGVPVAFPTETVYGLGAPVFDSIAVQRVFEIKGRPNDNPLIVHLSSIDQATLLGEDLPPLFFRLVEMFWPGPLTLVVRKKEAVPSIVSAGQQTVALRMPSHPMALDLIEALKVPLVGPSANLSGRPSPTSAQDVWEDLEGKIPLIIDGGACSIGIESTVLSLAFDAPVLLRPGSIRKEVLEAALGKSIALPNKETPILSPGMKYRHYAPKAPVRLIFDSLDARGGYLLSQVTQKNLYASLRQADRMGAESIEILCDSRVLSDEGLMNRLLKAAGQT